MLLIIGVRVGRGGCVDEYPRNSKLFHEGGQNEAFNVGISPVLKAGSVSGEQWNEIFKPYVGVEWAQNIFGDRFLRSRHFQKNSGRILILRRF
jgi:hypothetical protein